MYGRTVALEGTSWQDAVPVPDKDCCYSAARIDPNDSELDKVVKSQVTKTP